MKPSDPHEKVWKGEPWDDSIIAHMPRPSDHVRTVVFDAARQQAAAGVSKPFISRVLRWRLVPALGTVCILLLAVAVYWKYQGNTQPRGITGPTDPELAAIVEYATTTDELNEVIAETAEVVSTANQDQFLTEVNDANDLLALLEVDIEYDIFSM
jgi:hypothetical protein